MDPRQNGRPTGRPPLTIEQKPQRAGKEPTVDTHMNLPIGVVEKIDRLRQVGESRKDFIVRILRAYPE